MLKGSLNVAGAAGYGSSQDVHYILSSPDHDGGFDKAAKRRMNIVFPEDEFLICCVFLNL